MTQDEIIEMAKQAGIKRRTDVFFSEYCDGICFDDLQSFAKLVAAKEREACAEVCDDIHAEHEVKGANWCGDEIRARGQA